MFKFELKARRGNLIVTAFFIVIGMMVVVGGINTMLQGQISNSQTIKDISLSKVQAFYLAEMAINQMMFDANRTAYITLSPPRFPAANGVGQNTYYDFTSNVWMTRPAASGGGGDANSKATCVVTCTAYTAGVSAAYRVDATLVAPGGQGTYTKRVDFSAGYQAGPPPKWVLTSYRAY
jgi:hypothetical protein